MDFYTALQKDFLSLKREFVAPTTRDIRYLNPGSQKLHSSTSQINLAYQMRPYDSGTAVIPTHCVLYA
jgi:hypothetical protein